MEFIYRPEKYSKYKAILVKRMVDCSKITEDEFVKFIKEDVETAVKEYTPICEAYNKKRIEDYIAYKVRVAEKDARKKYKKESTIQKYIDKAREEAENTEMYMYDATNIFFDFKPDHGEMGINADCIIQVNDSEDKLRRAYKELINSKYCKYGKGWQFTYETSTPESTYSFRPDIELILDEDIEKQQYEDGVKLTEAVNKFYEGCRYWGD